MKICLYEPEIAQNTGTIARMCSCFNIELHIIEPASFIISDKYLKRSALDYMDISSISLHSSFDDFIKSHTGRIILFDTKGNVIYHAMEYCKNDCLLFGKESSGVPDRVFDACHEKVVIPMNPEARSLNLAISAAIGASHALFSCSSKST